MPEPALRDESQVEKDCGDDGACDEERFQAKCPDVRDVRDVLILAH